MANSSEAKASKMGKGGKILIGALLIVVIALLVVVIYLLTHQAEPEDNTRNVLVTEDNVDEVIDNMASEDSNTVAAGSYEVTMNTTWTFKDGASASEDSYVENSTDNTNDVYFDILEGDDEEVIYSSPIIPVGSHMNDITLDKDLDAGTYDCVIKYVLVDSEGNDLSSVRVGMTIVVEN